MLVLCLQSVLCGSVSQSPHSGVVTDFMFRAVAADEVVCYNCPSCRAKVDAIKTAQATGHAMIPLILNDKGVIHELSRQRSTFIDLANPVWFGGHTYKTASFIAHHGKVCCCTSC